MRSWAWVVGLAVVWGCGGSTHTSARLERTFAQEEVQAVRAQAPDLLAAAERARQQAEEAEARGDDDAAADHATRARLLLGAAVAEAKRLRLEAERVEAEREARTLEARALQAERDREEVAQRTRRALAAQVAREQAERAFAAAEEAEARRFRYGARARARYREAAEVLRERARLVTAAAMTLGTPSNGNAIARVEDALATSEAADDPAQGLVAAERAFRAALRTLGVARAQRDGPTPEEVQSLVRTASEMGLDVDRADRGIRLAPPGRRWDKRALQHLASLLAAHPHGPVRVEGQRRRRNKAAERKAEARARRLAAALTKEEVPEDRMETGTAPAPADAPEVIVLLLAYDPATVSLPPK